MENSIPNCEAISTTKNASLPGNMNRLSHVHYDSMPRECQQRGIHCPSKSPMEESFDARVDSTLRNPADLTAFATNIQLASWLMICPLPLEESIKESLTSLMSEREGESANQLPSLMLRSLDAMCERVKELYPRLIDGSPSHPNHAQIYRCCCCSKIEGVCAAHGECRTTSLLRDKRQESILARCERALERSLGVYDAMNKAITKATAPISPTSTQEEFSMRDTRSVGPSTPFDGYQLFLDSLLSNHTQWVQETEPSLRHKSGWSRGGPLDPLLSLGAF